MTRKMVLGIAFGSAAMVVAAVVDAAVLCQETSGAVFVGDTECRKKETRIREVRSSTGLAALTSFTGDAHPVQVAPDGLPGGSGYSYAPYIDGDVTIRRVGS